jgi:hypothetical protein
MVRLPTYVETDRPPFDDRYFSATSKKEELAFTDAISHATVLRLRNYRLYVNVVTQGFRRTVSPEKRRSRVVQDLPGMVDDLVMANIVQ